MKRVLMRFLALALAFLAASPSLRAEVFYGIAPDSIWTVDVNSGGPATQVATINPPLPANANATLAVRPSDGMVFYLDSQGVNPNLWKWNPLTPAIPPQLVGGTGLATGVVRLVFDLSGNLYAMNTGAGATLWTLNQNTGAFLTALPTSGAVTNGGGDICINPQTGTIYVVGGTALYTLDFTTGVVTLLGTVTGVPGSMTGCAFDHTGRMVTSPGATLYQVNTTTLVGTALPNATGATAFGDLGTAPGRTSDLSLAMVASTLTPGTTVSYTITLTNSGPSTDTGVQVKDLLPAGLTFVSATPSQGTYTSGTGIWNVGVLPVGSVTLTINATVTGAVSPVTNTAQVSAADNADPDSTPNNSVASEDDQASVTVTPSPDLQIVKFAPTTFAIGVNGTYTLTVNNTLGSAASSGTITVTDAMPTGLTVVGTPTGTGWNCAASTATNVNCTSVTVIAAGATSPNPITVTVLPAAAAAPSVTNTATVSGGGDGIGTNNTSTITTSVCAATCPDVTVSKTGPASFTVGATGTYVITVKNIGGLATSAAYSFIDTLPTGMTLSAVPAAGAGWTCTANSPAAGDNIVGGGRVACTSATALAAGASSTTVSATVNVAAGAAPSAVNNVAVSGGGEPPGNTGNDSFQLTTPVLSMDLAVTKTGPAQINVGGTGTYTFTVRNIGGAASTGTYTIDDLLPTGITISTVPAGTGWTCTAGAPASTPWVATR